VFRLVNVKPILIYDIQGYFVVVGSRLL